MNQPQKLIVAGGAAGLALMILWPPCIGIDRGADGRRHAFMYYQRTGRVPRRPGGYDRSKPVDGTTSRTEWSGLHPAADLLQVTNPPQGYMQNCDVPPDARMEDSPFRPERTIPHFYADLTQQTVYGHPGRYGAGPTCRWGRANGRILRTTATGPRRPSAPGG